MLQNRYYIFDIVLETEKTIFEAVLEGNLDLESSPWPTISESAKDLIRKMLARDPKKRITAAEALGMCLQFVLICDTLYIPHS